MRRREKFERLRRRAEYLGRRIDEAEAQGRDLTYDKSERSALLWAIGELEEKGDASTDRD